MALIRLQDNTPDIYVNNSRDFQLLCRLYDCVNNSVKYNIDSITNITNTKECSSKLLQLLQSKLGFISNANIDNESLRYILRAFPYIMRNKGSKKAILQALIVFAKIKHIKASISCVITNKKDDVDVYKIEIFINTVKNETPLVKDTTILDEIFKYILPTGYTVEYIFTSGSLTDPTQLKALSSINVVQYTQNESSTIRKSDDYADWRGRLTTATDTTYIAGTV